MPGPDRGSDSYGHLVAASLAFDAAETDFVLAAEAPTAGARRARLAAATAARAERDAHALMADRESASESAVTA
uniref:hypothetical protein n=1 Tax=Amycolatopsis sp. CA-096443 TaxID=3239919 RepID=UPI003F491200